MNIAHLKQALMLVYMAKENSSVFTAFQYNYISFSQFSALFVTVFTSALYFSVCAQA